MRADRLLSILLLLQNRGRMTAGDLAVQLEVSERTIYRDLEALGMAGVPVYSEHGPGGGYALLDSYRTTLTGLNEAEVRTLFLTGAAGPLEDLGLAEALEVALLKLAAALPESQQRRAERMRQRLHLDARSWFQSPEAVPYLQTLQDAVWHDRLINITYRRSDGEVRNRTVAPYGLVAKASIWYLVGSIGEEMRVYRVSRILDIRVLDEHFEHPPEFDLASYWTQWCADFESSRPQNPVTLALAPDLVCDLPGMWGEWVRPLLDRPESVDENGWQQVTIMYDNLDWACQQIMSLGARARVLAPETLRQQIIDTASSLVGLYRS
jgi:predicted DNA-binding transcriptional regulator YafY